MMSLLRYRRLLHKCLFVFLLGCVTCAAWAQSSNAVERQVKAAYLLKFGNYVDWPPEAFAQNDRSFQIGILGADDLADELAQMVVGRSVNGRNITVRKLRSADSAENVNLLYIGEQSGARLAEQLRQLQGKPVLLVTESAQALAHGSMINFVQVDGRLRFEVAPKNAANERLNISARLLAVAYMVKADPS